MSLLPIFRSTGLSWLPLLKPSFTAFVQLSFKPAGMVTGPETPSGFQKQWSTNLSYALPLSNLSSSRSLLFRRKRP